VLCFLLNCADDSLKRVNMAFVHVCTIFCVFCMCDNNYYFNVIFTPFLQHMQLSYKKMQLSYKKCNSYYNRLLNVLKCYQTFSLPLSSYVALECISDFEFDATGNFSSKLSFCKKIPSFSLLRSAGVREFLG